MSETAEMTVPGSRPVTMGAAGLFVVVCASVAAVAAAVPGRPRWGAEWNYSPRMWPLLVALVIAGVVMTHERWSRPAAVVTALVALEVAGNGVVAVRDWFNVNGALRMAQHDLATVVTFAAAVAVAATAAAAVAVAVLWREPAGGARGLVPARPGYVVLGVTVALVLPFVWATAVHDRDITTLGQFALTSSLPWGAGLAASGWLRGRTALAARVSVTCSVLLCAALVALPLISALLNPAPPD
ncbi:hypothetical protein [Actinoplanes sp. NPDC051494]|uniref:hypothetical protein n=1 Tax=Actinoplanes sp. NPDC051494 TaxID=3363907 RepID=UPI0037B7746B